MQQAPPEQVVPWGAVWGQPEAVAQFQAAASDPDSLAHAWLITGPPGSGRSTLAAAFAAALIAEPLLTNCNLVFPDEGFWEEAAKLCREASAGWGGKAIHIHTDVSDREAVKAMVEQAAAQMGRVDVRSHDLLHSLTRAAAR